jgi:vesicle-fusing ATPase
MDGVDQLNNVLIIGMTNRFDMIDEALLRPGRLEVHMEINLPDQTGRLQILKIHTQKMRDNGLLAKDVDLAELAAQTKNYSGAEIEGLVKSATSFAFNRHTKAGSYAEIKPDAAEMKVSRTDFLMALAETHPAFGVSEEDLGALVQGDLIMYSKNINVLSPLSDLMKEILQTCRLYVEQVRSNDRTRLLSVLLHGPTGSGKTALAAHIAMESEFPYIKLLSPESLIGLNEPAKVQSIIKTFNDAYKSPSSIIIADNIERLVGMSFILSFLTIDWTAMGARFSNQLLQTLLVLFRKRPPKNRRLLVIATTSERTIMKQMGLVTDAEIAVPAVSTLDDLDAILKTMSLFDDQTRQAVLQKIYKRTGTNEVKVGIKFILNVLNTCQAAEENAASIFVDLLSDQIVDSTYVPQEQDGGMIQ